MLFGTETHPIRPRFDLNPVDVETYTDPRQELAIRLALMNLCGRLRTNRRVRERLDQLMVGFQDRLGDIMGGAAALENELAEPGS